MEYLRKLINTRIEEVNKGINPVAEDEINNNQNISNLKFISQYDLCKNNFELDIEEENIKY
jgi:hypothetical protein